MKVEQQPAYLLHSRPYRETSLLVDFFTLDHGRVSGVLRGQRAKKGKRPATAVQPFTPVFISWLGRSELKTITSCEQGSSLAPLVGDQMFSGLYCNELLVKLLASLDPFPQIFHHYAKLLNDLSCPDDLESVLRNFELDLLDDLGYGVEFTHNAEGGEELKPGQYYQYLQDDGFVATQSNGRNANAYAGEVLQAIHQRDFKDPATKRGAKRLMRQVLDVRLGGKPILARELFRKPQ